MAIGDAHDPAAVRWACRHAPTCSARGCLDGASPGPGAWVLHQQAGDRGRPGVRNARCQRRRPKQRHAGAVGDRHALLSKTRRLKMSAPHQLFIDLLNSLSWTDRNKLVAHAVDGEPEPGAARGAQGTSESNARALSAASSAGFRRSVNCMSASDDLLRSVHENEFSRSMNGSYGTRDLELRVLLSRTLRSPTAPAWRCFGRRRGIAHCVHQVAHDRSACWCNTQAPGPRTPDGPHRSPYESTLRSVSRCVTASPTNCSWIMRVAESAISE